MVGPLTLHPQCYLGGVYITSFRQYLKKFTAIFGGQIFVFFILTVAAAESAIGLAILVVLFRSIRSINVDDLNSLKE